MSITIIPAFICLSCILFSSCKTNPDNLRENAKSEIAQVERVRVKSMKQTVFFIRFGESKRIEFYDACVANTMYSLQAGAKGMSAISGNFYPEILVWMCNNSTNPDKQEHVKFIQEQLTRTEDIISQNYPLSAKYFLRKRGLPIEISSRIKSDPLSPQRRQALDDTYKVFLGWCNRIGIEPAHS